MPTGGAVVALLLLAVAPVAVASDAVPADAVAATLPFLDVEERAGAKTPEAVLQSIRDGERLQVMREEGGVLADVLLGPEPQTAAPGPAR